MSEIAQSKVVKVLHQTARVQGTTSDPRLKIEAANWQLFFELPLWRLLKLRDDAVAVPRNEIAADHDEELPIAVGFAKQLPKPEGSQS